MKNTYLRKVLLSENKLLISADGYASIMMEIFPPAAQPMNSLTITTPPTYKEQATADFKTLLQQYASADMDDISMTDDYCSNELPPMTIAYHRIFGFISSSCRWFFSSKQFEQDLIAAEENPQIIAHFFHINTPGGEAWYLDRLSETIRSLQKPIVVLVEQVCASAGYYIGCHSSNIFNLTKNDQVGCIGTMADFWDFSGYYEQMGLKRIRVKATRSPLKNKKFEDLIAGKPKQYIHDMLDPLTLQFISEVQAFRPKLAKLPDDADVLQGETYDTENSLEIGLIDGTMTFPEAVKKTLELGKSFVGTKSLKRALKYI